MDRICAEILVRKHFWSSAMYITIAIYMFNIRQTESLVYRVKWSSFQLRWGITELKRYEMHS